jgi:antirestriction protein
MYERAYGDKCAHGWRDAAQIAKAIRLDIKEAIAAGDLPGGPKNYRVRTRKYSGGQAIDVSAVGLDGMYQQCEGIKPGSKRPFESGEGWTAMGCGNVWCKAGGQYRDSEHAKYHRIQSVEGRRVNEILQKIHDSYNWDGSEVMVDYFDKLYWGHAEVIDPERGY